MFLGTLLSRLLTSRCEVVASPWRRNNVCTSGWCWANTGGGYDRKLFQPSRSDLEGLLERSSSLPQFTLTIVICVQVSYVDSLEVVATGEAFVRELQGLTIQVRSQKLVKEYIHRCSGERRNKCGEHTCKKRVMLRRRLYWPKKIAEKVRKSRQNVNRDKSA